MADTIDPNDNIFNEVEKYISQERADNSSAGKDDICEDVVTIFGVTKNQAEVIYAIVELLDIPETQVEGNDLFPPEADSGKSLSDMPIDNRPLVHRLSGGDKTALKDVVALLIRRARVCKSVNNKEYVRCIKISSKYKES